MRLSSHRAVAHVAALVALLSVAACSDSPFDPLGPTAPSFARGGKPKPPPPPPPTLTHDPILFIHGWNASSSTWSTMVSRFTADGWTSNELVNWSYNYRQSNATTAAQIQQKVDSILRATGATKVDIITHSMGTLSARYYVRNLGGDGKVDALVSLGGANHGTTTAGLCFDVSCVEMRPNSTFLNNLNSTDETWGTPRYATWWSDCDEVINPHSSVVLNGAVNTQTACMSHSSLHEDAVVYQQVRDLVNTAATLASAQ
ncbi:MAG: lipase [Gemmatimonadetes bacterium]|nr:MAG: lipase [Gemmatimonadota bacterium]